ncbi:MAG: hypothetical protein Q9208_001528 [Pyrenodesmia sp. 3 TL-2023]
MLRPTNILTLLTSLLTALTAASPVPPSKTKPPPSTIPIAFPPSIIHLDAAAASPVPPSKTNPKSNPPPSTIPIVFSPSTNHLDAAAAPPPNSVLPDGNSAQELAQIRFCQDEKWAPECQHHQAVKGMCCPQKETLDPIAKDLGDYDYDDRALSFICL